MVIKVPEFVAAVLSEIDGSSLPTSEFQIAHKLKSATGAGELKDQSARDGWFAEVSAFRLQLVPVGKPASVWGTRFGPCSSLIDAAGNRVCHPDIKEIDEEVLFHWKTRSSQVKHPVLKARYCDLVWDLSSVMTGQKPDVSFARRAIEAYIEAVDGRLCLCELDAIRSVQRAVELSVSLNDSPLIEKAGEAAFVLHRSIRDPRRPPYSIFLFDLFLRSFRKKVVLDVGRVLEIVGDLEADLKSWSNPSQPSTFNHDAAKNAAERLISHYRGEGCMVDVQRVARIAGAAQEQFASMGDAVLAAVVLQGVHRFYQEVGLSEEADRVLKEAKRRGKGISECLTRFSTAVEVDQEAVAKAIEKLTTGEWPEVVHRVVREFLPSVDEIRTSVEEMKTEFPLQSNIRLLKMDQLTRAEIPSAGEDPEARIVEEMSNRLATIAPLLTQCIQVLFARHQVTADQLCKSLSRSPLFYQERQDLLHRALDRYLSADWISAIHILVPFIEESLRVFLERLGKVVDKREGTIYMAKELGAVLSDVAFKEFWTSVGLPDVPFYLRVLLTDPRGWNVRNLVAHGLRPADFFRQEVADRLVHVVLLLGLLEERGDEDHHEKPPPAPAPESPP